jgi:hypothetical protein
VSLARLFGTVLVYHGQSRSIPYQGSKLDHILRDGEQSIERNKIHSFGRNGTPHTSTNLNGATINIGPKVFDLSETPD